MSGKTKYNTIIPWVIAAAGAAIVMVMTDYFSVGAVFAPVTQALGISTVQAINEFSSGVPGGEPFWYERLSSLAGIILIFVVGPVLWIIGSKQQPNGRSFLWYAGVTLVIIGLIHAGRGLYHYGFENNVNRENREAAEQYRNIDEVRSELATLSNRAIELYWVPKNKGGVDKNFKSLTLGDLKKDQKFKNAFVMEESHQDSTQLIYGIGKKKGKNPDFKNANGEQGKIQVVVKINPKTLKTAWLKADSLSN